MQRQALNGVRSVGICSALALTFPLFLGLNGARAEQPPPPCHPNPNEAADIAAVESRGDIVNLPGPLQDRLLQLADRPHTYLPLQVFNEADPNSQLFQYYLLDTAGFEPNVFTTIFPGVNDHVQLTVTGPTADCQRSAPCAWCWSPSRGYRPIRTTRAPSTMCSPTFRRCS